MELLGEIFFPSQLFFFAHAKSSLTVSSFFLSAGDESERFDFGFYSLLAQTERRRVCQNRASWGVFVQTRLLDMWCQKVRIFLVLSPSLHRNMQFLFPLFFMMTLNNRLLFPTESTMKKFLTTRILRICYLPVLIVWPLHTFARCTFFTFSAWAVMLTLWPRVSRIFSTCYTFSHLQLTWQPPSSCPDHHMVSTCIFFFFILLIMCLHDEIFHLIRSFHSSSDEPFSGTDEG